MNQLKMDSKNTKQRKGLAGLVAANETKNAKKLGKIITKYNYITIY